MNFQIQLSPHAARQLRKLDPTARRRIQAVIDLLADNPRPPAAKQLVGGKGEWRVRTGDYRVIYEINDGELLILVLRTGHRREIYKR
jgi:mRNA interferase RelE/StbE